MSGRAKKPAAPRKKANGYKMPAPIPNGEVIHDTTMKKKWRIGPSIGVGGFGEIYSACDHEGSPKKASAYPYVIKIEPHENGPLFVEKHFYIRNCNKDDITKFMKSRKLSSMGMPTYFGNGSHDYRGEKYRYLVLERYGTDLWTVFKDKGRSFPAATVFQIGLQMLDVLEYIHSRGYVHADVKGSNILLGLKKGTENQTYLVDFGLATRVNDKEFKADPKCAHNGTIEYTSRDAHLGVATMRGDLEILGYNMLQWIVGALPWEGNLAQPKAVQDAKETFMRNVRANIAKLSASVPEALIKFFEYVNTLKPKDMPDYVKCRSIFETYLKSQGKTRGSKLDFTSTGSAKKTKGKARAAPALEVDDSIASEDLKKSKTKAAKQNGDAPKIRRRKKPVVIEPSSETDGENENEEPEKPAKTPKAVERKNKRKSTEPLLLVKLKKTKLTPKVTPPVKKNHANIATQTSVDNRRKSPRQVSFDSPICAVIGEKKPLKSALTKNESVNSSGDIFEDSFVIEEQKVKPKKKLLSAEELTVKKVVKKKTTTVQPKNKTWKDLPTVVNGRSPPK